MKISFTKAHGAKNDFLLSWLEHVPSVELEFAARRICDRHTGIGADGWILMNRAAVGEAHAAITLYNSDGSRSEISGNGTRCVAALLVQLGMAEDTVRIRTDAGTKRLWLKQRNGHTFEFEMDMGQPEYNEGDRRRTLLVDGGAFDVTILNVGNPQCVAFVDDFEFDWRTAGARIERHSAFPKRTNVSFVRTMNRNSIDVRFWERGAGETLSSGTGSTGAALASKLRGLVDNPVEITTPAGVLRCRFEADTALLTGPAELVGAGEFYL